MSSSNPTPLTAFANPYRVDIVLSLSNKAENLSELSKLIGLSTSETSRQLKKLSDHQIIQKQTTSRKYELSAFGRLIINVFSPMNFIFTHSKYFQSHLINIPKEFIQSIDALFKAELVSGTGKVMFKIQEFFENLENEAWIMTEQALPFGKPLKKANYIVHQNLLELSDIALTTHSSVHGRVLNSQPISLILSDSNEGMVFFRDSLGKIDYDSGFYVNDPEGIGFLRKLWTFYWESGEQLV